MQERLPMNKELHLWVEEKYIKLHKKQLKSKFFFIILNVIALLFAASMIILSVYSIKKNPYSDTKWWYVTIAILVGLMSLLTSILSFFSLNKNMNRYNNHHKQVNEEYLSYKKKEGKYKKHDEELFIDSILEIIHQE